MIYIDTSLKLHEHDIHRFTLSNKAGMRVRILSLGGIIQSIEIPDKNGKSVDVCLGFDSPVEYLINNHFFGACIGRCANRIANGAFSLGGETFSLPKNDKGNCLHGGEAGFHRRIWDFTIDGSSLILSRTSPHMEEGFPGNLKINTIYRLDEDNRLFIEYCGVCDRDTVVNLTNHTYFNLSGHGSGTVFNHSLTLLCNFYTPCGEGNIPTGEIRSVAGTPLDFTQEKTIDIDLQDPDLAPSCGYDHNYVVKGAAFRQAARLYSPGSGIAMDLYTTAPGLQFYTGNALPSTTGKDGVSYGRYSGLCLEPQSFPNAINIPHFPSPILKAGQPYRLRMAFCFYHPAF